MRKLIAGMKMSIAAKIEGSTGVAEWVDAGSDDYELTSQIDACVLGGGMYPGYEKYWTAVQNASGKPLPMTEKQPKPQEIEWGHFAARTTHCVLSKSLTSALWPRTSFMRGVDEFAALKRRSGKDIYLIGGARTTASLIDAGLVDELWLIIYPLDFGDGKALFATIENRHALKLKKVRQFQGGRVSAVYDLDEQGNATGHTQARLPPAHRVEQSGGELLRRSSKTRAASSVAVFGMGPMNSPAFNSAGYNHLA